MNLAAQRSPALRPRRRRSAAFRAPPSASASRSRRFRGGWPRSRAQLGERLLLRTTRKLTVTDFGLAVLEHARHVVEDVAAARGARPEPANRAERPPARDDAERPRQHRARAVPGGIRRSRYPAISLEVDLSARFVDLIGENFDVAIRMGDLRDDASLAARRIAVFSVSLYAAPAISPAAGRRPSRKR